MRKSITPSVFPTDRQDLNLLYTTLSDRRNNLDQLLWQVPVISLTAQAFLLTISFGDGSPIYKIASGLLALLIGAAAWHLFFRHGALEREFSKEIELIEMTLFNQSFQHNLDIRRNEDKGFSRFRAAPFWKWVLFLVSLAGLGPIFELIIKYYFHITSIF